MWCVIYNVYMRSCTHTCAKVYLYVYIPGFVERVHHNNIFISETAINCILYYNTYTYDVYGAVRRVVSLRYYCPSSIIYLPCNPLARRFFPPLTNPASVNSPGTGSQGHVNRIRYARSGLITRATADKGVDEAGESE